jgi:hypothetical protein
MLEHSNFAPDAAYPGILIDRFLSGGVTVIAPSEIPYGRILRRMMAFSVGTGDLFLDCLETKRRPVLFVNHGLADCKADKRWGLTGENIEIRDGWPRMDAGCIEEIRQSPFNVIFLPDYDFLDGNLGKYVRAYHSLRESDVRSSDYYRRQKGLHEIEQLRDCAASCWKYLILTAGTLTSNRKLRDFPGLGLADCKILIYEHKNKHKRDRGILTIEVIGGDNIGSGEFEVVLDEQAGIFRPTPETRRRYTELPLIDNDREILEALKLLWPMKEAEISKTTSIPRSTVYLCLKRLAGDRKGRLVVKMSDGKWTLR